ncbi:homoprotocatechuate degradation operon regulator, HpaR [Shimia thalassica]|uniref:Homoprotocatechuate degradation operon regulator, HpaR n=1 Tax=Shimia thalassica TaxID=1715693 RepID=A0A0P1IP72_9RHOB|nr:MarR family transcriptional regulator [Shimia thalassica]CUK15851.1 homoprotocatechuate degradation operon regulator, HpaR [Shimia thalassica]
MDRIDSSLVALRQILRATEIAGRELAQQAGLTSVQFRALQMVGETGQTTAKAIATRMHVSQATVTALVDRLVTRECVVREKSLEDRRQTHIVITEFGRQTIENAPDPLQQRFVRRFKDLEDWEQAMLVASLERVASMLDAEDLPAGAVLTTGELSRS